MNNFTKKILSCTLFVAVLAMPAARIQAEEYAAEVKQKAINDAEDARIAAEKAAAKKKKAEEQAARLAKIRATGWGALGQKNTASKPVNAWSAIYGFRKPAAKAAEPAKPAEPPACADIDKQKKQKQKNALEAKLKEINKDWCVNKGKPYPYCSWGCGGGAQAQVNLNDNSANKNTAKVSAEIAN